MTKALTKTHGGAERRRHNPCPQFKKEMVTVHKLQQSDTNKVYVCWGCVVGEERSVQRREGLLACVGKQERLAGAECVEDELKYSKRKSPNRDKRS